MATLTAVFCLFTIQAMALMDKAAADPNIDINPTEISLGISSILDINCTFSLKNYPDMDSIVSLNLLRANASGQNFEVLAVITGFSPESVNLVTQERVAATGVLNETGESRLQVTWDSPTATQGGVYQCAAHGLDVLGQNVEFTNTSVVTIDETNLDDIFEKLKQMEANEKTMENTISILESTLVNNTLFMENKVSLLENTIFSLESALANNTLFMENKESSMNDTVFSQANHIQLLNNTVNRLKTWRQNIIASQLELIGVYQDKEYYLLRENFQDITESSTICKSLGATLIEIDDENEYNAVVELLQNVNSNIKNVMIGGTDEQSEGSWVLPSTNQPLPYTGWGNGEPSFNTSYNCLCLNAGYSWQMAADQCHRDSPYAGMRATCEIPSVGDTDQK